MNKEPGEDGIPPGVFKALINTLIEMLAILFSNVMRSGEYPNCWSTGIICPIHKSAPRNDLNNYYGITLLNVMGNMFSTHGHIQFVILSNVNSLENTTASLTIYVTNSHDYYASKFSSVAIYISGITSVHVLPGFHLQIRNLNWAVEVV